jgi:class 3 adenylate cyclase
MSGAWKNPPTHIVPESLQHLLDRQEREAARFQSLQDSFRVPDSLQKIIAAQEREASRFEAMLSKAGAAEFQKFIEASTYAPSPFERLTGAAHAFTHADFDYVRGADLRHRLTHDPEGQAMSESSELQRKLRELESQLTHLRTDVDQKAQALRELEAGSAEKDQAILELQQIVSQLSQTQRFAHLLAHVETAAQKKLLESADFRREFERDESCDAFVMSIDIRRSTELMLKARDAKLFAEFLLGLTRILREIVLVNHGVFDKFTGDGVLAFFPTFYSGCDAGLLVLQAAEQAHAAFRSHYNAHRHCFLTVRTDVGLGIGVDFGRVQVVQIESEFTVVGTPVVYACRMGGAEAGQTLVNQPAYEQLSLAHSVVCDFAAVELEIKHEGRALAYAARLNGRPYSLAAPPWLEPAPEPA